MAGNQDNNKQYSKLYSFPPSSADPSLPDQLNLFFTRFEDGVSAGQTIVSAHVDEQPIVLDQHQVKRALQNINIRKEPGPDGVPGRALKVCAHQLAAVWTDIFNRSLKEVIVPTCLKTATIIPVPKQTTVACLNDYRPIALTPVIMKCFERLVLNSIKAFIPANLDKHQFAYRANRCTDDAISLALHTALTHLENPNTYVRMLFVDFSSAFNTINSSKLVNKLLLLGLDSHLCKWIKNFLTDRPQHVRLGNITSSTTILNTGTPQGCVLSPLLYSLFTYDCFHIYD